jgi:predicted GNAT family N-acyltransferase/nitroimidazol reductase NimA-like FMN-containing flavoprotein (pyridoxamine 5'-phosphate oxidase superfamily)
MRLKIYQMEHARALQFLSSAPTVRIATSLPDGTPVMRTVHGALVDGYLAFHGSPVGEKVNAIGRPAVASAEEVIAPIPSYFIDPERACPATTYYLSVQVHADIERTEDPDFKTRVLAALMTKLQPQGGYAPLNADHPLYRNAIQQIMVLRMSLKRLDGKAKLGQNRTPAQLSKVIEALWQRGLPGDPRAIDLVRRANPDVPCPDFLNFPLGLDAFCALGQAEVEEVVKLLKDEYWNVGIPPEVIGQSHLNASAWIGAKDREGRLVCSARALSDYRKHAWIYDVIVDRSYRGHGIGQALMRLMLDHPAVRHAANVGLATRDAQSLYSKFGFCDVQHVPAAFPTTQMALKRTPAPSSEISARGGIE